MLENVNKCDDWYHKSIKFFYPFAFVTNSIKNRKQDVNDAQYIKGESDV